MQRKALGKGLGALIPTMPVNEKEVDNKEARLANIPLGEIIPNRYQPRKTFDNTRLQELAESIKENGIIQPVIVHKIDGKYELITGERRWRAVQRAGLKEIPAIIKDVSNKEKLELALIENIQREDLNPIEEAEGYKELMTRLSLSHEQVAKKLGKDRSTISNSLRLLKLPKEIKIALIDNSISMGHARAVLSVEEDKQKEICNQIVNKKLTVRETENYVKNLSKKNEKTLRSTAELLVIKDIQDELTRTLGTKVTVRSKGKKGKIEIDYYSLEDLDRILGIIRSS